MATPILGKWTFGEALTQAIENQKRLEQNQSQFDAGLAQDNAKMKQSADQFSQTMGFNNKQALADANYRASQAQAQEARDKEAIRANKAQEGLQEQTNTFNRQQRADALKDKSIAEHPSVKSARQTLDNLTSSYARLSQGYEENGLRVFPNEQQLSSLINDINNADESLSAITNAVATGQPIPKAVPMGWTGKKDNNFVMPQIPGTANFTPQAVIKTPKPKSKASDSTLNYFMQK